MSKDVERITAHITKQLREAFNERSVKDNYHYDAHYYYKLYTNEGRCTSDEYPAVLEQYKHAIRTWCQANNFNLDGVFSEHRYGQIDYIYVEINWLFDS